MNARDEASRHLRLTSLDVTGLAAATGALGTSAFPQRFCAFCADLAGAETAYLAAFFDSARPAEIYSTHVEPDLQGALALYLDVAFVLDPFYHLYHQKAGDRVDRLRDIAPEVLSRFAADG